ncbi:MAG: hypothetical protein V3T70_12160 [Phycisphaerae bacterium]
MQIDAPQLRRIDWTESFPWTRIFRSFSLAYNVNQLLLALAAVLLIALGGWLLDEAWNKDSRVFVSNAGGHPQSELTVFLDGGFDLDNARAFAALQREQGDEARQTVGVFSHLHTFVRHTANDAVDAVFDVRLLTGDAGNRGLIDTLIRLPAAVVWLLGMHFGYAVVFIPFVLAVLALFGGAICRIAALQATREERIGLVEAMQFSRTKFAHFFGAPLMPVGMIAFFAVLMFVGGILARLPGLDVLAGLIWFLPLIAGLIMAIMVIASFAVWPLMHPAIAVEGTDAFDAFSRGIGYAFEKRWRTPFYFLVAMVYGLICLQVIKLLARLMFWLTHAGVGFGMNLIGMRTEEGADPVGKLDLLWKQPGPDTPFWGGFGHEALGGTTWAASGLIHLWALLFVFLIAAFVLSFFFSASTWIYLLLRRDVDGTDLEYIWSEEDEQDLFAEEDAAASGAEAPGDGATSAASEAESAEPPDEPASQP